MTLQRYLDLGLATVWLVMGLYGKVLGKIPRHEQIVGEILGSAHATALTRGIGVGEILFAIWIAAGWRRKWSGGLQIALVLTMNALEVWRASELLLWGPANFVFALAFCGLVYWNAFRLDVHCARFPCSPS